MGILKKIFGPRFIATEIEHPIFGKMSNDKNGFWNGVIDNFPVINSQMDFSIKCNDLNSEAESFLQKIQNEFENIYKNLEENMFEGIDDFEDGTTMLQVFDSLNFYYIFVWDIESEKWELSADTKLDDHIFRIQMKGTEYQGFAMDG